MGNTIALILPVKSALILPVKSALILPVKSARSASPVLGKPKYCQDTGRGKPFRFILNH
jgi:hypothetical protein